MQETKRVRNLQSCLYLGGVGAIRGTPSLKASNRPPSPPPAPAGKASAPDGISYDMYTSLPWIEKARLADRWTERVEDDTWKEGESWSTITLVGLPKEKDPDCLEKLLL